MDRPHKSGDDDKMSVTDKDYPGSLSALKEQSRRRAMLGLNHIVPLQNYVTQLRRHGRGYVPDFDPLDGGIDARILFLFEKPGPKTDGRSKGSGFISRNNNDPTAKNVFEIMRQIEIPREKTILWNVIPWWNGEVRVKAAELRKGVEELERLIELLLHLRAVILVGKKAARAKTYLINRNIAAWESAHPSSRVQYRWPEKWDAIPGEWAKAKRYLN